MNLGRVFLFLFLADGVAFARLSDPGKPNSCTSVSYEHELGPVRNQGDKGWCYAYAAADLVSQKIKHEISAVGIVHSDFNKRQADSVARDRDLMDAIGRSGMSREEKKDLFEQSYERMASAFKKTLDEQEGGTIAEAIENSAAHGFCLEKSLSSGSGGSQLGSDAFEAELRLRKEMELAQCPDENSSSLKRQLEISRNLRKEAWNKVIDERCETYLPATELKPRSEFVFPRSENGELNLRGEERKRILNSIDAGLEGGRVVGLTYDVSPMLKLQSRKKNKEGNGFELMSHASVIVGRSCSSGCDCKYLLRNSWGRGTCDNYEGKYRNRCRDGNVLLTAEEIGKMAYGTTVLP